MGTAVFLIAACVLAKGELTTTIDLRENADDAGYYILFCARYERVNSFRGDAYVLLGRGRSPEDLEYDRRYGLHLVPGRLALEDMTAEQVAASRGAEADADSPPPEALIVQVDGQQYEAAKAVIDEWRAKESFDYAVDIELAHMSEEIFRKVGLYPPYRAAFRAFNPIEYYTDLRKLNENRGRLGGE